MKIEVFTADYENSEHGSALVSLLDSYARDPLGDGKPLPENIKNNLARELSKLPHAFSILCYVDEKPAGLINCFEAFSTFQCKPLINIHDVIVSKDFRGLGISQLMMNKVEDIAREKGFCKLTLEVLEPNQIAQNAYTKFGFSAYEESSKKGKTLFWQKQL